LGCASNLRTTLKGYTKQVQIGHNARQTKINYIGYFSFEGKYGDLEKQ